MRFESIPQGRSFLQLLCLSASPGSEAFCLRDEQHYASRWPGGPPWRWQLQRGPLFQSGPARACSVPLELWVGTMTMSSTVFGLIRNLTFPK